MNDKAKPKSEKFAVRSMVNNLNSAPPEMESANFAKFLLTRVKEMTGETQQLTLSRCVNFAMKNSPEYSRYFEKLEAEWNEGEKGHQLYRKQK